MTSCIEEPLICLGLVSPITHLIASATLLFPQPMEPTIPVGSIVYVKPVDFSEISEGDIISFEAGASVVTHRVESIDESQMLITTKGDANETRDGEPVIYENIIGKPVFSIPVLGYLINFIKTPYGLIVAISTAALLIFIGIIVGSRKKDEKNSFL